MGDPAGCSSARGDAGFAQEAKKAAPPKPAPSPSQAVLESWNDVGRKLIAIAEDLPEDKYDYKPNPDFADVCGAAAPRVRFHVLLHRCSRRERSRGLRDDPKRDELKTKEQVVAFVKKCVEDGADVIKAKGDKGMTERVLQESRPDRLSDLAYGLIEHSGEHYGQLVVYYRINGMVPPESRPKK